MRRNRQFQLLTGFGHSSVISPSLHPAANQFTTQDDRSSEKIVGLLFQLVSEIHRMMDGLNQDVTDLGKELGALQTAYERIGNLRLSLALHQAAIDVLTQQESREILDIVREVLDPHARDADTHATVSIRKRGTRICLRICGSGAGFMQADGLIQDDSMALIQSRVRKIRGTMRVQSEKSRRTQLLVEFRLEPILVSV